ncbi:MAG: ABC transporter substrate-binding protein, partial [Bdellovibrionales bacterium]|nr:ABC transporter substrate-binding protein [Bdellovibrionales bacterium]
SSLTYKFYDYQQDISIAVSTRKLAISENVDIGLGTLFSKEAIAVGAEFEKARTPLIVPTATNPAVTKDRKFVYRATFSDQFQAKQISDFVKARGEKKILIVTNISDPYSSFLSSEFKKTANEIGIETTSYEFIEGQLETKDLFKMVSNSQTKALFLPLYHKDLVSIYSEAKKRAFRGTFFGSDSVGGHEIFMRMIGELDPKINFFFTKQWSEQVGSNPIEKEYKGIKRKYCPELDDNMQLLAAFDTAKFVALSARYMHQHKNASAVEAMENTSYQGVLGSINYNRENRDLNRKVYFFRLGTPKSELVD